MRKSRGLITSPHYRVGAPGLRAEFPGPQAQGSFLLHTLLSRAAPTKQAPVVLFVCSEHILRVGIDSAKRFGGLRWRPRAEVPPWTACSQPTPLRRPVSRSSMPRCLVHVFIAGCEFSELLSRAPLCRKGGAFSGYACHSVQTPREHFPRATAKGLCPARRDLRTQVDV